MSLNSLADALPPVTPTRQPGPDAGPPGAFNTYHGGPPQSAPVVNGHHRPASGSFPETLRPNPRNGHLSRPAFLGGGKKNNIEDVYIAVMGVTGAGKSSFINLLTGHPDCKVGHSQASCTQVVGTFSFEFQEPGGKLLRVHLVDTPGFDDTNRKDSDVLKDVAGFLGVQYKRNIKLCGIIYLHRISDPRMQGSAKRNLYMFQKLCGKKCFPYIVLATTFWGTVDPNVGARRERELVDTEDFWGCMTKKGSRVFRHSGDRESALQIIAAVLNRRQSLTLEIQDEMINRHKDLDDTEAGIQLDQDIYEERQKHKRDMRELQDEMNEALRHRDQEAAEHISELQAELQEKIEQSRKAQESLKTDLETLQKERDAEFEKLQKDMLSKAEEIKLMRETLDNVENSSNVDRAALRAEYEVEMENLRLQIKEVESKQSGTSFFRRLGNTLDELCDDIGKWWDAL